MSIKAREALKKCMELGKTIDLLLGNDESTVWNCRYERSSANSIVEIAKEALSEPLKNCDIGTAEEQSKRFREFCSAHKYVSSDFSTICRGFGKNRCPFFNTKSKSNCELAWSQMPYEGKMKE